MADPRGGMDLGDFLGEETRSSRGSWLKNWKDAGSVVVWLHTRSKIHARFAHQFPYVDVQEDKETRQVKRVLRQLKFGCWESDAVLSKRYFRNSVTGERDVPPVICPACLLQEAIVDDDRMKGDATVFAVKGRNWQGEPAEANYRKGNLTGEFARTKTSWKENIDVRKTYLFTVVLDKVPGDGPKIAEESQALGDAVRNAIRQQMDSEGSEAGNPSLNPYAFKWVFNAKTSSPKDFYSAYAFRQARLTDEIRDQITVVEPSDLAPYCRRGDPHALRTAVEAALTDEARRALDLDPVFARSMAEVERGGDGEERVEPRRPPQRHARTSDAQAALQQQGGRRRKKVDDRPPEPPPAEPCDECGAPMRRGQTKCGKCGTEYEDDGLGSSPDPTPSGRQGVPADAHTASKAAEDYDDDIPF